MVESVSRKRESMPEFGCFVVRTAAYKVKLALIPKLEGSNFEKRTGSRWKGLRSNLGGLAIRKHLDDPQHLSTAPHTPTPVSAGHTVSSESATTMTASAQQQLRQRRDTPPTLHLWYRVSREHEFAGLVSGTPVRARAELRQLFQLGTSQGCQRLGIIIIIARQNDDDAARQQWVPCRVLF
eukprot:2608072-Rhodomonas_salina.2